MARRLDYLVLALWAVFAALAIVLVLLAPGCGSGIDATDPAALDSRLLDLYVRVEQCVGATKSPPEVRYEPTSDSPTGKHCCLANEPWFDCGGGVQCCVGGAYSDGSIILPDECDDGAAHEMIHHLIGDDHDDPRMRGCEGLRA